jgi:hypothetical protein
MLPLSADTETILAQAQVSSTAEFVVAVLAAFVRRRPLQADNNRETRNIGRTQQNLRCCG